MKSSEKLFLKYRHLAKNYAGKLFDYQKIGFEKNDVIQELEIRLYEAILAYGRRWNKYKKGEAAKPVQLSMYLRTALNNRVKDFIQKINDIPHQESQTFTYDIGKAPTFSNIDFDNLRCEIDNIDILKNLNQLEKEVVVFYLMGYKIKEIVDMDLFETTPYKNKKCVECVIDLIVNKQLQRKTQDHLYDLVTNNNSFFIQRFDPYAE